MAAFMLYVTAAPPGFYWLDSAELSAAAVALGVPHPTGFPLYCIVARVASLVPLGELAFRIELVSAVCAALAVFWITRLVLELCRADGHALVGAAVAGTLLALSAVFLRQATVAEVYAPSAALLAGGLLLLDQVSRGGDARWGLALALVCGLALALHVSAWLLGPVAVALMGVRLYRGARWPLLAPLVALAMAGGASAYLPVRSASGHAAVLDWGHPDQAGTLLAHVSARGIRSAFDDEIGALDQERLGPRAEALVEDIADHVGPIAPLAALLGLVWLARQRRSRWPAAALFVIGAGDLLYALWVNPMGQTDWQNGVPLALTVSAGAGAGVAWLSRFLRGAGPFVGAVAGVLLVVPPALVSVPAVWPASAPADGSVDSLGDSLGDSSGGTAGESPGDASAGASGGASGAPRAWAEAALAATPPRGLALVQYDSTAAGLLYLTEVEQARPDVTVLVRQFLVDPEYVRAALARGGVDTRGLDRDLGHGLDPAGTLAWILAQDRPVVWELGRDGVPAGMDLRIAAPLVALVPGTTAGDRASERGAIATAAQTLARIFAGAGGRDRIARREHARALTALGRTAYGLGDLALAAEVLRRALLVRPAHVPALVNLGVVAAHAGDFGAAAQYTERAVALAPAHVGALVNVTRYLMQMNQDQRAQDHIERALRLDPRHAGAWALAATLDLRAGRRERALQRLGRALALDAQDADARVLLGQLDPALDPARDSDE